MNVLILQNESVDSYIAQIFVEDILLSVLVIEVGRLPRSVAGNGNIIHLSSDGSSFSNIVTEFQRKFIRIISYPVISTSWIAITAIKADFFAYCETP